MGSGSDEIERNEVHNLAGGQEGDSGDSVCLGTVADGFERGRRLKVGFPFVVVAREGPEITQQLLL